MLGYHCDKAVMYKKNDAIITWLASKALDVCVN